MLKTNATTIRAMSRISIRKTAMIPATTTSPNTPNTKMKTANTTLPRKTTTRSSPTAAFWTLRG